MREKHGEKDRYSHPKATSESEDEWSQDKTVRSTKKFLLSAPGQRFIKTKNPKCKIHYQYSPEAFQISEFLGGNWNETIFDVTPEKQSHELPYKASL